MTQKIRWGILGAGDVCEVKSGPAFQKAEHSELVAVMRRDPAKAEDFAWTGRVDYVGTNGLLVGLSGYYGDSGQGLSDATGARPTHGCRRSTAH